MSCRKLESPSFGKRLPPFRLKFQQYFYIKKEKDPSKTCVHGRYLMAISSSWRMLFCELRNGRSTLVRKRHGASMFRGKTEGKRVFFITEYKKSISCLSLPKGKVLNKSALSIFENVSFCKLITRRISIIKTLILFWNS